MTAAPRAAAVSCSACCAPLLAGHSETCGDATWCAECAAVFVCAADVAGDHAATGNCFRCAPSEWRRRVAFVGQLHVTVADSGRVNRHTTLTVPIVAPTTAVLFSAAKSYFRTRVAPHRFRTAGLADTVADAFDAAVNKHVSETGAEPLPARTVHSVRMDGHECGGQVALVCTAVYSAN